MFIRIGNVILNCTQIVDIDISEDDIIVYMVGHLENGQPSFRRFSKKDLGQEVFGRVKNWIEAVPTI